MLVTAVTADLAQISLSALIEDDAAAENAEALAADNEMLGQIIQGYSIDPWFASPANTALLDIYQGNQCITLLQG